MNHDYIVQRLSHHAYAVADDSLTYALWQADRQARYSDVLPLFEDLLLCFESVNNLLNTQSPSGTVDGKPDELDRSLVTSVSKVLSDGWHYYWLWTSTGKFPLAVCHELASILIQIGIAWDAVLAGDIDDIRAHVKIEYWAREYNEREQPS
jgi:hypothetical protein